MKILAIDTSSHACSIALLLDEKIHALHEIVPMQQAQCVLPMINSLLQSTQTDLKQLNAIAFGCGPGSFTGVRIATSVAQGLAFAASLPLIRISSLAALAQSAYDELGWENLLVGVDARIQEVYWGIYKVNQHGLVELIGKEKVCAPQKVELPEVGEWYGAGNAWEVYRNEISFPTLKQDTARVPTAAAMLRLAKEKFSHQEFIQPEEAVPTYLRDDVAKKSKQA